MKGLLIGLLLIVVLAVALPSVLDDVSGVNSLQGTQCVQSQSFGFAGLNGANNSTIAYAEPAWQPGTSGDCILSNGDQVIGNTVEVAYKGPAKTVNLSIEQWTPKTYVNSTWHPPAYNGTPSPENLTEPGYWRNVTLPYRADPVWGVAGGGNFSIALTPWASSVFSVTIPHNSTERALSICYGRACFTGWHVLPNSLSGAGLTYGSLLTQVEEFGAVLGIAFGFGLGIAVAAKSRMLEVGGKPIMWLLGAILPLGLVYVAIEESPLAWAMLAGTTGSFAVIAIAETWLFFLLALRVLPSKAEIHSTYQSTGNVRNGHLEEDFRTYRAVVRNNVSYWIPRGGGQAIGRLLFGERFYAKVTDTALTPRPFAIRNVGDTVDQTLVVPAGQTIIETLPRIEFFSRDPAPPAPVLPPPPPGTPPVAPPKPAKGRLRLVRLVPGGKTIPAVGETEARNILDHGAQVQEVASIELDRQQLENENVSLRASIETGKSARARALLSRFFEGVANSRALPQTTATKALQQAMAELQRPAYSEEGA